MYSEGLILLLWIASIPEYRIVQHFLLILFSEKYYCTASLKRVKNLHNLVKFHLHRKNETLKLIAKG
jgi:hypothetical protein